MGILLDQKVTTPFRGGAANALLAAMAPSMLNAMAGSRHDEILREARRLMAESRRLLQTDGGPAVKPDSTDSVIGLYDELRTRLDEIGDSNVDELLRGISDNIGELKVLAKDVERIQKFRRGLQDD